MDAEQESCRVFLSARPSLRRTAPETRPLFPAMAGVNCPSPLCNLTRRAKASIAQPRAAQRTRSSEREQAKILMPISLLHPSAAAAAESQFEASLWGCRSNDKSTRVLIAAGHRANRTRCRADCPGSKHALQDRQTAHRFPKPGPGQRDAVPSMHLPLNATTSSLVDPERPSYPFDAASAPPRIPLPQHRTAQPAAS